MRPLSASLDRASPFPNLTAPIDDTVARRAHRRRRAAGPGPGVPGSGTGPARCFLHCGARHLSEPHQSHLGYARRDHPQHRRSAPGAGQGRLAETPLTDSHEEPTATCLRLGCRDSSAPRSARALPSSSFLAEALLRGAEVTSDALRNLDPQIQAGVSLNTFAPAPPASPIDPVITSRGFVGSFSYSLACAAAPAPAPANATSPPMSTSPSPAISCAQQMTPVVVPAGAVNSRLSTALTFDVFNQNDNDFILLQTINISVAAAGNVTLYSRVRARYGPRESSASPCWIRPWVQRWGSIWRGVQFLSPRRGPRSIHFPPHAPPLPRPAPVLCPFAGWRL